MDPADQMALARSLVSGSRHILVLTGAGVSAESGVPTFRGEEGLWRSFRAEELATPEAFEADPDLVWSWYQWRRARVAACRPNEAHRSLARLALWREGVTLVTQNVDGLHELAAAEEAAGTGAAGPRGAAAEVVALHGALYRSRCSRCPYRRDEPREASAYPAAARDAAEPGARPPAPPPPCPVCGAPLRPDVVWFGEQLDPRVIDRAWQVAGTADLCLVVGTSGLVQPAASLASVTRRGGGRVIEVNTEATPITPIADLSVRLPAAAALPAMLGPDGPRG